MNIETTRELLNFIDNSPSPFHAVNNLRQMALEAGFVELQEEDAWQLAPGGSYFVIRNDSSIAAFRIPKAFHKEKKSAFHIVAAHSDSPTFKLKENPEIKVEEQYVKLNTEKYGGMIMSTWFDRPLSVAGRIVLKENGKIVSRLVNVERDICVIPSLAIHMNRDANKGTEFNAQTDMLPLFSQGKEAEEFLGIIAKEAGVGKSEILAQDLFLYVREKGKIWGGGNEFMLSSRLDDLQCAFAAMYAITKSEPAENIDLCVIFDNEEVGSGTRQGADSTFLRDILERVKEAFALTENELRQMIACGLLISADNAHAVHPNHPEKADPTNRPYINGGIVLKYHGSQKYTTDAYTAAALKELCREAGVPVQTYANRSDIPGGSTLGNISTAHVSIPSVDIGMPQLAMHSAVETGGTRDTDYAIRLFKQFYQK